LEALAVEIAQFFDNVPVAEGIGAKLSRMMHGFLETEMLPQAEQATDLGLDPTPLLAVVSDVLRVSCGSTLTPESGRTLPIPERT
jgi:hypothetical protein